MPVPLDSVSVVTAAGTHSVLGASDALATELEARQLELGVGPHREALRTGLPASLSKSPDDPAPTLWQQLEGDLILGEAAALFAFPLRLGAATVGVADLSSRSAVELRREVHQAIGMVMARLQCSAGTALVRLRAHACATAIPLDALARTITARRFDDADL